MVLWIPAMISIAIVVFYLFYVLFGMDGLAVQVSDAPIRTLDFGQEQMTTNNGDNIVFRRDENESGRVVTTNLSPYLIFSYFGHGIALIYETMAVIIAMFFLLGAAYGDRRDRSVLFWKSMPFGETQSLLVKLVFASVVIPFLALAISFVVLMASAFMLSGFFAVSEQYSWWSAFVETDPITIWLSHCLALPILAIKVLPLYCWLLFCSAFVKKSPIFLAIIVPMVIVFIEMHIVGSTHFLEFFSSISRLVYWQGLFSNVGFQNLFQWESIFQIDGLYLGVGLVMAVLLFSATVWLRNNRFEI